MAARSSGRRLDEQRPAAARGRRRPGRPGGAGRGEGGEGLEQRRRGPGGRRSGPDRRGTAPAGRGARAARELVRVARVRSPPGRPPGRERRARGARADHVSRSRLQVEQPRRARRAVASVPTMTAAPRAGAGPAAAARTGRRRTAGRRRGISHGARSRSVTTTGRPGRDRQRPAAGGVVDGPRGAAPVGAPGRPQRRAAQQERVDGHRAATAGSGSAAGAGDRRRRAGRSASVGSARSDCRQKRERLALERVGVEGAEQPSR